MKSVIQDRLQPADGPPQPGRGLHVDQCATTCADAGKPRLADPVTTQSRLLQDRAYVRSASNTPAQHCDAPQRHDLIVLSPPLLFGDDLRFRCLSFDRRRFLDCRCEDDHAFGNFDVGSIPHFYLVQQPVGPPPQSNSRNSTFTNIQTDETLDWPDQAGSMLALD